jgi:hypothetical protein
MYLKDSKNLDRVVLSVTYSWLDEQLPPAYRFVYSPLLDFFTCSLLINALWGCCSIGYPLPHHLGRMLIIRLGHLFCRHRRLLFLDIVRCNYFFNSPRFLLLDSSFFLGSSLLKWWWDGTNWALIMLHTSKHGRNLKELLSSLMSNLIPPCRHR